VTDDPAGFAETVALMFDTDAKSVLASPAT
jgi:hypothetical protein